MVNGAPGAINQADDAVLYGNSQPKIIGGWIIRLHIQNFDVNSCLPYQLGFYTYYGSGAGLKDQRF